VFCTVRSEAVPGHLCQVNTSDVLLVEAARARSRVCVNDLPEAILDNWTPYCAVTMRASWVRPTPGSKTGGHSFEMAHIDSGGIFRSSSSSRNSKDPRFGMYSCRSCDAVSYVDHRKVEAGITDCVVSVLPLRLSEVQQVRNFPAYLESAVQRILTRQRAVIL
jgi:hypothetical protein